MPETTHAGRTLRYAVDGDGPTVAFVGDVGTGPWLWSFHQPVLAGQHRTVVWDLPGTGGSDPPPEDPSISFLANCLDAVLAAADATDAHVVGAGLGGAVGVTAAHDSTRIASVLALGTPEDGEPLREGGNLAALRADPDDRDSLAASLAAGTGEDLDGGEGGGGGGGESGGKGGSEGGGEDQAADQLLDWREREDAELAVWDRYADAFERFEPPPTHEITTPVRLVHGREDDVVPSAAGRALATALPRGSFATVPGAHWWFLTTPERLTDEVVAAVDDANDGTAGQGR